MLILCLGERGFMPLSWGGGGGVGVDSVFSRPFVKLHLAVILFEDKADSFMLNFGIESDMFSLMERLSEQPLELELGRFLVYLFVLLSLVLILLSMLLVNYDRVEIASSKHVHWIENWNIWFQFLALLSAYHVALGNFTSSP